MIVPDTAGQLYLIDTSAQARIQHPAVRAIIAGLIADRAAATAVTVDLEAGYSGRSASDVRAIAERRHAPYVVLPISEAIAQRAREVQVAMAAACTPVAVRNASRPTSGSGACRDHSRQL